MRADRRNLSIFTLLCTKVQLMKLFKGGLIYDGTGSGPYKGDILVEKVYINGVNVLDGDVLDTEAIRNVYEKLI